MSDPVLAAVIGACALLMVAVIKEVWSSSGQRRQNKRETSEDVIDEALKLGVGQYVAMMPPLPVDKPTLVKASVDAIRPLLVAHLDCDVPVIRKRLKALRDTMIQPDDALLIAMLPALTWFNTWCEQQVPTLLEMRRQMGFRWLRSDQAELQLAWNEHFTFIHKWIRQQTERLATTAPTAPLPG